MGYRLQTGLPVGLGTLAVKSRELDSFSRCDNLLGILRNGVITGDFKLIVYSLQETDNCPYLAGEAHQGPLRTVRAAGAYLFR